MSGDPICEKCREPITPGQSVTIISTTGEARVITSDDALIVHADCDNPDAPPQDATDNPDGWLTRRIPDGDEQHYDDPAKLADAVVGDPHEFRILAVVGGQPTHRYAAVKPALDAIQKRRGA